MLDLSIVRTSHLADAADSLGHPIGGGGGLRWLGPTDRTIIGKAYTIHQRGLKDGASGARPLQHREVAARLAEAGDVIVVSVEGATRGATWGEAHTMRALNRSVAGFLIDGWIRDAGNLAEMKAPMLCRGSSPFKSTGRLETVSVACKVEIQGVRISHGDMVAIDADGFVCVPAEFSVRVLEKAKQIAKKEDERNNTLLGRSCN